MISGIVNSRHEATIHLIVQGMQGTEQEIEVIIDTGFSGSMTLPPALITALDLPFRSRGNGILADGSETEFDIYSAIIIWDGAERGNPCGSRRH